MGDQILHQLLFWAEFFCVHDQQLALVGATEMNQQLIAETSKPNNIIRHNAKLVVFVAMAL